MALEKKPSRLDVANVPRAEPLSLQNVDLALSTIGLILVIVIAIHGGRMKPSGIGGGRTNFRPSAEKFTMSLLTEKSTEQILKPKREFTLRSSTQR
tara:strand:+ start:242 stop:529 length:288 start_codon:yes stop_codon:yes gene_type:complete